VGPDLGQRLGRVGHGGRSSAGGVRLAGRARVSRQGDGASRHGTEHLRKIPVLDDFTIDLKPLEQQITADRANGYHPICVVGNAGTINTGAVDPLDALAEFCPTHGLWFHVDVAYGGPAARTQSPRHCSEGCTGPIRL
jgi:Pyridoxal-dependent decarboxylase conserved domain